MSRARPATGRAGSHAPLAAAVRQLTGWLACGLLTVLLPAAQSVPARDATPADASAPDGALAHWEFLQGGRRIGSHWCRDEGLVELPGGQARFLRAGVQLEGLGGGPAQRLYSETWLDARDRPLRHLLRVELGDVRSEVDLRLAGGKAFAHLVQGGAARDLEVAVPADAWLQANNFLCFFELLFARDPPDSGEARRYTLFSATALQSLPYAASLLPADEPAADGLRRVRDSLGETITLDARGRVLRLELPGQDIVMQRSDEPAVPFELAAVAPAPPRPDDLQFEEVEVSHGAVHLAGCVSRPRGVEGRLPALLFLSGSGQQDRDGRSNGLDLGTHEILDRLTRDGFLVLRMDDRGTGGSSGPLQDLTLDELLADARAALDLLLAREDVDAAHVALLGHSEGGVTAPLLALERPQVAALVLLAAAGRPVHEIILEQNALLLSQSGLDPQEQSEMLGQIEAALLAVVSDEPLDAGALPESARPLLEMRPWLQSHARRDPAQTLAQVPCPVLLLQGALDFQVSPERDAQRLHAARLAAGRPSQLVVLPGLDHLFKRAPGERSQLADYFAQRPVDAQCLDLLSEWLAGQLRADG